MKKKLTAKQKKAVKEIVTSVRSLAAHRAVATRKRNAEAAAKGLCPLCGQRRMVDRQKIVRTS
jgi:hypothetical protein